MYSVQAIPLEPLVLEVYQGPQVIHVQDVSQNVTELEMPLR